MTPAARPQAPAGLCAGCRHRRMVGNRKGSLFLLCRLSATDARYPRYPPLPVLACAGLEPGPEDPWSALSDSDEGEQ